MLLVLRTLLSLLRPVSRVIHLSIQVTTARVLKTIWSRSTPESRMLLNPSTKMKDFQDYTKVSTSRFYARVHLWLSSSGTTKLPKRTMNTVEWTLWMLLLLLASRLVSWLPWWPNPSGSLKQECSWMSTRRSQNLRTARSKSRRFTDKMEQRDSSRGCNWVWCSHFPEWCRCTSTKVPRYYMILSTFLPLNLMRSISFVEVLAKFFLSC